MQPTYQPRYAAYLAAHGFASQADAIARTGSNADYINWLNRAMRAFGIDLSKSWPSQAERDAFTAWLPTYKEAAGA